MILLLAQAFPPRRGGVEGLMAGLAKALAQSGEEVVVFADAAREAAAFDSAQPYGVRRFGGLKPLRRRLKAAAADRWIAAHSPRAVFADTWKSSEHLRSVTPLAVLAHGNDVLAPPGSHKGRRVSAAFAKARVVIANSRYTAEKARALAQTKVVAIAPGVEVIAPPRRAPPVPTPYIATLARLEPRKGIDVTLRALASLGAKHAGVRFAIAGAGADEARLKAIAAELGLSGRADFLGAVTEEEKASLYAGASVFVLPTRREGASVEGYGLVYREAAQFGVPAIAGSEGGAADAVAHGETGLVVDGKDIAAVAGALDALLCDEAMRARLGAEAKARVVSEGLWPRVAQLYLDALA